MPKQELGMLETQLLNWLYIHKLLQIRKKKIFIQGKYNFKSRRTAN